MKFFTEETYFQNEKLLWKKNERYEPELDTESVLFFACACENFLILDTSNKHGIVEKSV